MKEERTAKRIMKDEIKGNFDKMLVNNEPVTINICDGHSLSC